MNNDPNHLDLPPFPPLNWDDYDWWNGTIDLSFGSGADLTVTLYDLSVTRIPSEAQRQAMSYQLERGQEIFVSVLAALLPYYEKMRPQYLSFLGSDADTLMPAVHSREELAQLINLRHVHVHPRTKKGVVYVGLQFRCTWDQEHGLGFLIHQDRVVDLGGADVSFAWRPDEADDE